MPISSTMLLILIYMTRPTATRRNHRGVHRDGNYKFMYPLPSPSRAVRKSFRSGRFAFRDLLRPPLPAIGPRSFRVFALFLFLRGLSVVPSVDRSNGYDGFAECVERALENGERGFALDLVKMTRKIVQRIWLILFHVVKWFTCPWIRNYFAKIRL